MSTPNLVRDFYDRIWNAGDVDAASQLLAADFTFRGSLGVELSGQEAFIEYVRSVRTALKHYRCEVLDCVTEGDCAFARLRFSGTHIAAFRGFAPTGKPVAWLGAALFRLDQTAIRDLWVLGDLNGLDSLLRANQKASE
jgi:steroid delta-isomerase-like uncharacterized protein